MKLCNLTDADLIVRYTAGDEASLEVLVTRHKQNVFGFIYSKVFDKQLAEDLFQDTFVKIIRTLKKRNYKEEGKFLSWALRIAHNLVMDHFRKTSRIPKFDRFDGFDIFGVLSDGALNMEGKMIQEQIFQQITDLVKDLPILQKEVLLLRIYNELSFKEIAEKTGVSINTVLGRMRYALINMRKLVDQKNLVLTH